MGAAAGVGKNQENLGRVVAIRIFEEGAGDHLLHAQSHGVVHGFQSFWLEGDRIFSGRVWRSDVDRKTATLKSLIKRGGEAGKHADRGEKK